MKKFTNILALVIAVAVCVGALTACSGNQEDATGTTSTTAPAGADDGEANKPQQEVTTTPSNGEHAG